jgi:formate-dependent nitrite reductase membrane component NrfD
MSLDRDPAPAAPAPHEEPPASAAGREDHWVADHTTETRDMTAALGHHGAPASWERAQDGAPVALQRRGWRDAAWSFLYKDDTSYAASEGERDAVRDANRAARTGAMGQVHGPMINEPVWTWEVPLYFWFGGIAAGSSFVALACDVAGDHRSARIARRVALGAALPSPPLLVADLGRPGRFLNMMRIFKPRSPMNLGAWALVTFSGLGAAAVGADLLGRPKLARRIGGANAVVGGYLGSYTGVLLATTAVPVWARSRAFLGPIFVSTAAATGAAACRLVLVASGVPERHPTRTALGGIETVAMLTELGLSSINEARLGHTAQALEHGRPGTLFSAAKWLVRVGFLLQLARLRAGPRAHHAASVAYLGAGLCFRFAWVTAGPQSARDHEAVARMARGDGGGPRPKLASTRRRPLRIAPLRLHPELVRRISLLAERVLPAGFLRH